MSRALRWSPLAAALLPVIAIACSPESPVEPTPAEPEDEVLEGRADPAPPDPQPVPNEFIVILRDDRPIPPGLVQQLVGDHDLTLKHEYAHVLRGFSARVPPQALPGLQNNPFVETIAPNLTYTLETPAATLAPIDVPTNGLRVRLVANDLGPGDVGLWPNRGSDSDAVQSDATRQPAYRGPDGAFGGHASVGFNEGNDDDEVLEIPNVSSHASATVIAVLRQEDAKPHDYILAGMYGGANSRAALVTQFTRGKKVEYWDTSSGSSSGTTKLNHGQTYVVSWRIDGGDIVAIHVDGVPAGSGVLSASMPSFDRYLLGMGEPTSADRFDGRVGEIMIYDRVLADCERDGIVADLGTYYGVAVSGGAGSCGPSIPANPTGLAAAASGTSGIDVSWTDASTDEDGFRIERRLGQAGIWEQISETAANQASYADSGLDAATEYCYRVAAFNGDGVSDYSNTGCATTDAAPSPPADPTGLTTTASGTGGIDLSWTDASTNEDGFRIERRLGQDGTWGQIAETAADEASHADSSLEAGTEYCYRVAAFNGDGASGYSDTACATTDPASSPPADPTGLTATASGTSGIDLSWTDASTDEDGFRIERRLGQDGGWGQIAEIGPDAIAFSDEGLVAETEYCYRVDAFNTEGTSGFSNVACAATAAEPSSPPIAVPENGLRVRLVADDLAPGDVGLWPNRGSEGNAVQTSTSRLPSYAAPGPEFGGHASVSFNVGSDNDEVLVVDGVTSHESGTLFVVFRPEATNAISSTVFAPYGASRSRTNMPTARNDGSSPMDYATTTTGAWLGGTLTPAVGQTHVGVWRVDSSVWVDLQLNGQPAGGAAVTSGMPSLDRYLIGMAKPSSSERFDGWVAELIFYDRPLPDCERDNLVAALGQQYEISVAVSGGMCSPPADPTGLTATPIAYDGIDLAWTDASTDEDGFRIERRLGRDGSWEQIATTGPDATAYESRSLIQQTEYCYRVSAFNGDGSSALTDAACATTETAPQGACVDTGNHDDLSDLYGIVGIGAPANQAWASTQQAGCEIEPWYFGIDSGVDSDHPDLNVVEALSFVAAEPNHDGEDRNGHGTHTAGSAAARDGNGGVVGVAPGARIHSFRVCEDGGSCQTADMVAAMDAVMARKLDNPGQPMVANMSIGGPADVVIDEALRNSINAGIVYAVAAGNGVFGACVFPADAANVSPARVGDDEILPDGQRKSDDGLINGVLTTTSHNASFADVNCNYGAPVSLAAPGYEIRSTWLSGGYNTISGTSMASPHAAGAALLYLQSHPDATPAEVEAAIVSRLQPWTTNESPNASGRLYVDGL